MPLGRGLNSLIPSFKTAGPAPVQTVAGRESDSDGHKNENRLWHIPLASIKPNPYQPRKNFSRQNLEELINSIKAKGIIQPLLVNEAEGGHYELIAGERRFRSAEIIGLPTVPAIIKRAKNLEKLEIALIENLQRKNLNPLEEAFAFERLIDDFGLTHEEISKKIGKSRPYVSNILRLLTLPEEIQKGLAEGAIGHTAGRAILGLPSAGDQVKMYRRLRLEKNSVREMEETAEKQRLKAGLATRREPLIIDYEQKLRESLGTKVRIVKRGEKGYFKIDFYSNEELKRIVKTILE